MGKMCKKYANMCEICKNMLLCVKYAKYAVTYRAQNCITSYETNLYLVYFFISQTKKHALCIFWLPYNNYT